MLVLRTALLSLSFCILSCSAHAGDGHDQIDCQNAGSTVELTVCSGEELDKADAALNTIYKKALALIPQMSAEAPYDAKNWEAALRTSQRTWLTFRDAECGGHVPMFWGGGTGTTAGVIGCKTQLTRARIQQLENRYENR